MSRSMALWGGVALAAIVAWFYFVRGDTTAQMAPESAGGAAIVAVEMPALSGDAALGALAFKAKCATCHGEDAGGLHGKGPPLIHKTYRPGHHGEFAFVRAAKQGARSHHWRFGDMPPVEGITDTDIKVIIAYVRAVQKANGIF